MPILEKSTTISNGAKLKVEKLNKPNESELYVPNIQTRTLRNFRSLGTSGLIKNAIIGNVASGNDIIEDSKSICANFEKYDEDFTQENLNEKWQIFLSKLKTRPALKAAMSSTPNIKNRTELVLNISNKIAEEEINKIKPEVEGWLRRELKNTSINLTTKIEILTTINGKPLTETELFEKMKEKNPDFQKLVSALQLSLV